MRLKGIYLVAAFLIILLTCFTRPAAAENLRLVWADYEQPGNPIYLSQSGEKGWETEAFPPAASFTANYAPCLGIAPDNVSWMVWAARHR